jgi:hypothetical protein
MELAQRANYLVARVTRKLPWRLVLPAPTTLPVNEKLVVELLEVTTRATYRLLFGVSHGRSRASQP